MTARGRKARPHLTFEQANSLTRSLIPVARRLCEFVAALRTAGFSAFDARCDHELAYCRGRPEADLYRLCAIESAEMLLGRPHPVAERTQDKLDQLHLPPIQKRLQLARDKRNGCSLNELRARYPGEIWRSQATPWQRRLKLDAVRNGRTHKEKFEAACHEQRRVFEQETQKHASGLSAGFTFDCAGRYLFVQAAMEKYAGPLGFRYAPKKSYPDYPVFSKPISPEWDLCWALEDKVEFCGGPRLGNFAPQLQVRASTLKGTIHKVKPYDAFSIDYCIVPWFDVSYWKFFSLDELETCVKAHLYLYGLMAAEIERTLQTFLSCPSSQQ